MKIKLFSPIAVALAVVALSGTLYAHHGANLYESTKETMLKGTITQYEWGNPHNQIFFDVKDDKGAVIHWVVSTEPPAVMTELGWTRKSLKAGDQITAYVLGAKNDAPVGNLRRIVMADGKVLTTGGAGAPGAGAAPTPGAAPESGAR